MAENKQARGSVKWFDVRRGFGFVSDEDGTDYFVHHGDILMEGFRKLKAGQEVTFEAGHDGQGRTLASNVKPHGLDAA